MRKHRGKTIDVDVQWKGIGDLRGPDTRLRFVLLWNAQRKDYMVLVTNLDGNRFPPSDLYQSID